MATQIDRWRQAAAVAVLITSCAPSAATDRNIEPVDAIWRIQSLPFEYQSFNTQYACDSLTRKIRSILLAVGADPSVIVESRCTSRTPMNQISIRVLIATPVAATEENVRAATTFDGKDELIARLRNTNLPTAAEIPRFQANWQKRSLSNLGENSISSADCGLLRDLTRQIFEKIDVRVTRRQINCSNYASRIRPIIEVHALVPAEPEPQTQANRT